MIPQRIQRKRSKGWKMPPDTIYVGRPTAWGNPLKLMGDMIYIDAGHRRSILSKWVLFNHGYGYNASDVVNIFHEIMNDLNVYDLEEPIRDRFRYMRDRIKDLQGKNLACFCKEGEACHADVLLKLANL